MQFILSYLKVCAIRHGLMNSIYFDNNATTPFLPEVSEWLNTHLSTYGNPSSIHEKGRKAKAILRESRTLLANVIGANSDLEIIFTSGGSEANNLAIKGIYYKLKSKGHPCRHMLLGAMEHSSLMSMVPFFQSLGVEVELIPIDRDGFVNLEQFESQLREETFIVSMMYASNETGTLFPIKKMAKIAHKKNILFHSDCVQGLGKTLLSVSDLDVDLASFSSHKFYAPKGVGLLYVKKGIDLEPLIHGGGQERSRRGGTENVMGIGAFGEAARLKFPEKIKQIEALREKLEENIVSSIPNVSINGKGIGRVSNTSNMVLPDIDGEMLLMNLDLEKIHVSTGSACSSGSQEPSSALRAMGLSVKEARSSLRVSLGWQNTQEEVEVFCEKLCAIVERLRSLK